MNAICILANDMTRFKLLVDNFPKDCHDKVFVVNDTRLTDKTHAIHDILRHSYINTYEVLTDIDINSKFESIVNNEFVYEYTMSMNILMAWYILKYYDLDDVLFLDDDIIISKNPSELFDGHSKFKIDRLRQARRNLNADSLVAEYINMFGVACSSYDFYTNYVNGGHYILHCADINMNKLESALIKFFTNDTIAYKWHARRSHISYQLDERFITMLAIQNNISNNDLNAAVKMFTMKNDDIKDVTLRNCIANKYILHICNSSHKTVLYNRLIQLKLIKGEPI